MDVKNGYEGNSQNGDPSLFTSKVDVNRSNKLKKILAFIGPAFLISVGYMDPGNWATDIEGGARLGYSLIWVLLMSNIMAIVLQNLAAKMGIATGSNLARECRRQYPPMIVYSLWVLAEIAIIATDLAEVIGTIVGINLLFHVPLYWGALITAFDTLLFLVLQRFGVRKLEAFILSLVALIGLCFAVEILIANPEFSSILGGFVPQLRNDRALFISIGIIGATVMPHNLYLHSALVSSRDFAGDNKGKKEAIRYNLLDSAVALNAAFLVNAAILITAAADFFTRGIIVTEIQQAHAILDSVLGNTLAPIAFATALLAAGQSSTITGTMAGQVVMTGFIDLRVSPWLLRLGTRLLALGPAIAAIILAGSKGIYELLILSQVVLSLQLPFAIVPLIDFTSNKERMGIFANSLPLKLVAWIVAGVIMALNMKLVWDTAGSWISKESSWLWIPIIPALMVIAFVLIYIILRALRLKKVLLPKRIG